MSVEINGVAHLILTVRDWQRSAPFYRRLGELLGLTCVMDSYEDKYSKGDGPFLYYVGGRTALGIMQAKDPYREEKFVQWRAGLHHVSFRVKSPEDVDKLFPFLKQLTEECGGRVVQGPQDGPWAPGYRSVLIEDPDGIRLEWNYVEGKGLLGTKDKKLFSKL
eukprot:TRINITY_DN4670_c0_g2_i3.p1 TRINITY_DN4670_c0_g2~~TRINITY_DN4670_c0_g2_i3.p1  ORF type:complete len:163 (+),score=19.52 TRINITY_DN4670_c0_g2_i3:94-582(+)